MGSRFFVTMTVAVASVAVAVFGIAQPAAASGYGYDGQDPFATGCASSKTPVGTFDLLAQLGDGTSVGTGTLWYSTSCGTNWVSVRARYASPPSPPFGITTNIYRNSPPGQAEFPWTQPWVAGAVSWSDMLYAPVVCVYALGAVDNTDHGEGWGWIHQPGC